MGFGETLRGSIDVVRIFMHFRLLQQGQISLGVGPESPLNTPCVGLSCSKVIISQIPIFHMLPNFRQRFRKPQESTTEHQMRGGLVGACWTAK